MSKKDNVRKGNWAEDLAEQYLVKNGYTIMERNFHCRRGEIDIIAQQNGTVVFIEVKYRKDLQYGYPREAVGFKKQQALQQTALHYIACNPSQTADYRFDVIELLGSDAPTLEHIKNAFDFR